MKIAQATERAKRRRQLGVLPEEEIHDLFLYEWTGTDDAPEPWVCIMCEAVLPFELEGQMVCSSKCAYAYDWGVLQAEQHEEFLRAMVEQFEDHNAGCWSYSW